MGCTVTPLQLMLKIHSFFVVYKKNSRRNSMYSAGIEFDHKSASSSSGLTDTRVVVATDDTMAKLQQAVIC